MVRVLVILNAHTRSGGGIGDGDDDAKDAAQ
jgi:hypothetical protein